MKIILIKSIPKLGNPGDIADVAPSFARNYLIPKGLAKIATSEALRDLEIKKAKRVKLAQSVKEQNIKVKNILEGQTVLVKAKANEEGVLFAGVGAFEIAKNISKRKKVEINPKQINLARNLKTLGKHEVVVELANREKVKFYVEVSPQGQIKDKNN